MERLDFYVRDYHKLMSSENARNPDIWYGCNNEGTLWEEFVPEQLYKEYFGSIMPLDAQEKAREHAIDPTIQEFEL